MLECVHCMLVANTSVATPVINNQLFDTVGRIIQYLSLIIVTNHIIMVQAPPIVCCYGPDEYYINTSWDNTTILYSDI